MRASTHTELYRRFEGTLRRGFWAPFVLARSGIRTGLRSKKPLMLFAIPVLHLVTTCFMVNMAFSLESDLASELGAKGELAALARTFTKVEGQIVNLLNTTQFFTLIVLAWYGAGLIADDRRVKAHLLYFARPLTRVGYILGKLLVVGAFGALAIVAPATIVLLVAVFSSPDWSFLRERSEVIFAVEAYALAWVLVHAVGILAISSLAKRKNHALVAAVGLVVLTSAVAEFLAEVLDDNQLRVISVFGNFDALAVAWLGVARDGVTWPIERTYAALAGIVLVSLAVLARQVGRMEREA